MAEFSRLLSDRRSIRKYKDEKVDVELVREITQGAGEEGPRDSQDDRLT